jgi:hypothetical protein
MFGAQKMQSKLSVRCRTEHTVKIKLKKSG